jgi:cobalt-zinc-cadmium resistance protein CzcA
MTLIKKGVQSGEVSCCSDDVKGPTVMWLSKIKERIEQIQKTLPEGVIVEPFLDRTKMVNNSISTVEKTYWKERYSTFCFNLLLGTCEPD